MRDDDAGLSQDISHIAKLNSDMPSNGLNNDQAIEMAALEDSRSVGRRLNHVNDYPRTSTFAPEPFGGPNLNDYDCHWHVLGLIRTIMPEFWRQLLVIVQVIKIGFFNEWPQQC